MKRIIPFMAASILLFSSCVAKRVLKRSRAETAALRQDSTRLANQVNDLQANVSTLNSKVGNLNNQNNQLSNQNSQLGQKAATQADQLNQTANQLNQTKETVQQQQQRLQQLQSLLAQQRLQSEALRSKMAEALKGFNSNDLSVTQKNGKVYVRLSENLLFPSGSAVVNPKGIDALAKLAAVLNLNNDVAVNIEGHT
ncbi:MAG: flagellar motor protein MotB, partial [Sphingobacteriales bacterium]|nr:flagellar motor protein MotB [Sphingobacteriales bacterium]